MKKILFLGLVAAFGLCNSANAQKRIRVRTPHVPVVVSSGQVSDDGNTILVEGAGMRKHYEMNGGTLHIQGADNVVDITGFADRILIEGAGVVVHIDRVNAVKIEGADSKVYYRSSGNRSGKAAASVFGAGSSVIKVR